MPRLIGALLDWNGTAIDDISLNIYSATIVSRYFGCTPPTKEECLEIMGRHDSVAMIYDAIGMPWNEKTAPTIRRIRTDTIRRYGGMASLREGLPAFLRFSIARNIHLGIVSRESEELLLERVEKEGIKKYFNLGIEAEVKDKKRALAAMCEKWDIPPCKMCYLDDTPHGITAARALGMVTFGFTNGHAAEQYVREANPTHAITSFAEVSALMRQEYL